MFTFLLLTIPVGSISAQEEDPIEQAKEQRELARQEQLAAEAEIALLEAEDIEIVAALEAATNLVNLQEAKEQAAQQRLQSALAQKIEAQEDFLSIAREITLLEERAIA